MKIELTKRVSGSYTFYEGTILGAKFTLSKKLVDKLTSEKKLKKTLEVTDDMTLVCVAKEGKNGRPWANLYLTVKEAKFDEIKQDDDFPF